MHHLDRFLNSSQAADGFISCLAFEFLLKSHIYTAIKIPVVGPFAFTPQTNRTRVLLEADRDSPFQAVSVWLFGPHQGSIDSFTPGQMKRINWTKAPGFTLAEPNRLGMKAP